jgi:hypothetical protein
VNDDRVTAIIRDRLVRARDSLDQVPGHPPASEIFARIRKHRNRSRIAAVAAACTATGLVLALVLPAGSQTRPVHEHLAAWSVETNPNGTVTFKLRNTSHPAQLQRVLAEAGVPAIVRWGQICLAQGGASFCQPGAS